MGYDSASLLTTRVEDASSDGASPLLRRSGSAYGSAYGGGGGLTLEEGLGAGSPDEPTSITPVVRVNKTQNKKLSNPVPILQAAAGVFLLCGAAALVLFVGAPLLREVRRRRCSLKTSSSGLPPPLACVESTRLCFKFLESASLSK